MSKRKTCKTHCTDCSRARLQNSRPGAQSWGKSWLPQAKSWLLWRGSSRSGVSKRWLYKGDNFRHSVSLSRSPIKSTSWKRAGLFADKQRVGSLEWVGAIPRKAWHRWMKSSSRCWGRWGETRIYGVETPVGAKNIKGLFEYPPAFSSARHLPPLVLPALFQRRVWSDDRGSDYWLLSVCHSSPFTSHRSCTFFWCKISCLGWPGVRPVPQMPLINLIARGSWGPVAQAKSPVLGGTMLPSDVCFWLMSFEQRLLRSQVFECSCF